MSAETWQEDIVAITLLIVCGPAVLVIFVVGVLNSIDNWLNKWLVKNSLKPIPKEESNRDHDIIV